MMPAQQRSSKPVRPQPAPPLHPAPAPDTPGISWQRRACLLSLGVLLVLAGMLALLRSTAGGVPTRLAPPAAAAAAAAATAASAAPAAAQQQPPAAAPPAGAAAPVTTRTRSALIPTMWRVTRRVPHDASSFTQGLAWRGRVLYEGSGMLGHSQLRRVSLAGGQYSVLASTSLDGSLFGEGVTLYPGEEAEAPGDPAPTVLQLTWQNGQVLAYDADTLAPRGAPLRFASTANEGWGLTHDGAGTLIMSDGSSSLHFWDASPGAYRPAGAMVATRAPLRVVDGLRALEAALPPGAAPPAGAEGWHPAEAVGGATVRTSRPDVLGPAFGRGAPLARLNELEYAHGWVLSNVWYDKHVAIIDPESGEALWYLDLSPLYEDNAGRDCLNGLAYTMLVDAAGSEGEARLPPGAAPWAGRLWVTGKYWNWLYELELGGLVPAEALRGGGARGRRAAAAGRKQK
jgi:glutamine cyclotransferase